MGGGGDHGGGVALTSDVAERLVQHGATAERIGMTRQTVIAIEQNKYAPSLEAAFRIADVFGASIDRVFRWTRG